MLGLTTLGIFHTMISLVAVVAGFWAFARDKEIVPSNRLGQLYLAATAITAATGLMIFEHGGIRTGHKVSILLQFRGREMSHKELGIEMINKFTAMLADVAKMEQSQQSRLATSPALWPPIPSQTMNRPSRVSAR